MFNLLLILLNKIIKKKNYHKHTIMKTQRLFKSILVLAMVFGTFTLNAQSKNIVETAISTEATSTLVAAVKAADLVNVLSSEGPFTVFAPTNDAFAQLPDGTVANLLKPENKETLQTVLKYHVVAGKYNAKDIIKMINEGKGKAEIRTVAGGTLEAMIKNGSVYVKDANGNAAKVTAADLDQTNGVIHVIDKVVLPK